MIPEYGIKTLDDVDVKSRTVFVRVDMNSPIDPKTKEILDDTRIRAHAKTISELADKGAKVVVLAHQGRPGEPDFTSLKKHAERLATILERDVKFVDDIFGEKAKKAIKSLNNGDILVLENVRMWPGETVKKEAEEHAKGELVSNLGPFCEVFVIDAFAAAHRPHASLVGFAPVAKEVVAGRIMEAELKALARVLKTPEKPCVYVLGGAKAEDAADITETVLGKNIADLVLTGGLVANLFLHASGISLGKPNEEILEKKGFLEQVPRIKRLLEKFGGQIILPVDLGVETPEGRKELKVSELPTEYLIKDIGKKTMDIYREKLLEAKTIVINGPMGVFENPPFDEGTRKVFEAIASAKGFSLVGGGHTIAAASSLGFADKVSYLSTGGGALIEFLVKGTLPVVEVLKKYSR